MNPRRRRPLFEPWRRRDVVRPRFALRPEALTWTRLVARPARLDVQALAGPRGSRCERAEVSLKLCQVARPALWRRLLAFRPMRPARRCAVRCAPWLRPSVQRRSRRRRFLERLFGELQREFGGVEGVVCCPSRWPGPAVVRWRFSKPLGGSSLGRWPTGRPLHR